MRGTELASVTELLGYIFKHFNIKMFKKSLYIVLEILEATHLSVGSIHP